MKKVCFYNLEMTADNENVKTFIDAAFDGKSKLIYKVWTINFISHDNFPEQKLTISCPKP